MRVRPPQVKEGSEDHVMTGGMWHVVRGACRNFKDHTEYNVLSQLLLENISEDK